MRKTSIFAALLVLFGLSAIVYGQLNEKPTNRLPNPYETVKDWARLPDGRTWGSTSAVEIDRDGKSIWVAERCGANSCADSMADPVLHFDQTGRLIKSFGGGLMIAPHGIFVDRDDNIWVTDCTCTGGAGGARDNAAETPAPPAPKGHQVLPFLRTPATAPEMRLEVTTPAGSGPASIALSANGRRLVFVSLATGQPQLWLRDMDTLATTPLAGTEGATYPFCSPDGRYVGFFADDQLKRIDINGGRPQVLYPARGELGGSWGPDDVILFAPSSNTPLFRISASGGEATL